MKNFFLSCLLFCSALCITNSSATKAEAPKGCQFTFSYQVKDKAITMASGISDPYYECIGVSLNTKVYFGNGDSASWVTPSSGIITSYTYPAYGEYTLQVWTNGNHDKDFAIGINDGTPCDSLITCVPSFNTQLYYSEEKEQYSITAARTDVCKNADAYWKVGGIIIAADTLQWKFGNIGEGSLISVCSHLLRGCADTSVCKDILLIRQDAVLIGLPKDSTDSVNISPNPVHDYLQVVTNLQVAVALKIFLWK